MNTLGSLVKRITLKQNRNTIGKVATTLRFYRSMEGDQLPFSPTKVLLKKKNLLSYISMREFLRTQDKYSHISNVLKNPQVANGLNPGVSVVCVV